METSKLTISDVEEVLKSVSDPEIPTVSIVDLGMVEKIEVNENHVRVELLPTFLGCPALNIIEKNVVDALNKLATVEKVEVIYVKSPPWTSDRITEEGKAGLKKYGIAPPPTKIENDGSWHINCPYCGSPFHSIENIFGPSACRSILYCKSCKNPFEAMKPISVS